MIVLASDYDGTLKINGKISELDLQAICDFRSKGNCFGIVTGKTVGMIKHELIKYHVPFDFLICANGAVLVDKDYHILQQTNLCLDEVLTLIEDLKQRNVRVVVSDGNQYGMLFDCRTTNSASHQAPELSEDCISGEIILKRKSVSLMVICANSDEEGWHLKSELEKKYQGKLNFHYNSGVIDVTAFDVDKSKGIKRLKEQMNAPVYVIGDGFNDICMLKAFDSFALNHAKEEVKKQAKQSVASIEECIKELLKRGIKE